VSVFTPAEIAYFGSQRLGRIATGGRAFGRGHDAAIFRIRPRRINSWGLEGERRRVTVGP